MQMSNLFRNKKEPEIICQSNKSKGIGYLVDLLCATRIGKKAPKLYENRGYKMAVFSNDYIGILINQFGIYERDELQLLFEFLRPIKNILSKGSTLDVGANIGNHSLYFSSFFSKVFAYEPNPDTFGLLKINAKNVSNIQVHNYGLGDKIGTFFLEEYVTNIGGSHILNTQNDDSIEIKVSTLDSVSEEIENIVFIKIDVEGFEEKVLRGGLKCIDKFQPIIVLEQDIKSFDGNESPAIRLLRERGYQFFWQHKDKEIDSKVLRKFFNFYKIAIKKNIKIVTGSCVPTQFHSMLIAVSPRYTSALNLES